MKGGATWRRVFQSMAESVFTLFCVVILTFSLLHFLPGGPFDLDTALPPGVKAALNARYHLDAPLINQFYFYGLALSRGDLGTSYRYGDQGVKVLLGEVLPPTFLLGGLALIVAIFIGLGGAILGGVLKNKFFDRVFNSLAIVFISVPVFILAPVMVIIFSFWLDWFPPALWEGPRSWILPALALAFHPAALIYRVVRATSHDIWAADFIRTARAKGVSEWDVGFKHVLRNSLVPVLSLGGTLVSNILSGSFVVELIFAIPGAARYFIDSVLDRDYPLVMAVTILYAFLLIFSNLFFEIISTFVDPRLRRES